MKHFLLIPNKNKPKAVESAKEAAAYLEQEGCLVSWAYEEGCECVIVFGGDGTLLRAARDLRQYDLTYVGVNQGTLGYLTEIDSDHMEYYLERLIKNEFHVEKRMRLYGTINREGETIYGDAALNDIVVGSRGLTMICFRVYVDGKYLATYKADGMVFSTPTGSTAYNLSAGGPIVNPEAELLVLTPVAPHGWIGQSIVLGPDSVVDLEVLDHPSREDALGCVSFDGNESMAIQTHDIVHINRSNRTTGIITFHKQSFLETLREKMEHR